MVRMEVKWDRSMMGEGWKNCSDSCWMSWLNCLSRDAFRLVKVSDLVV